MTTLGYAAFPFQIRFKAGIAQALRQWSEHGKGGPRHHRRFRHLRSAGPGERARRSDRKPLGRAVGAGPSRHHRRPADRVPAAARQGPPAVALRHQLSRQYRRAEARRRHRPHFAVGLRFLQGGAAARHLRAGRPVRRPHPQARKLVLRQGLRRPCVDGASGLAAAAHPSCGRCRSRRHRDRARRHLCLHGRAAILDLCREHDLQESRLFRDRHDQHARSQARPRGRDLLRHGRDGDRFRLLASRP